MKVPVETDAGTERIESFKMWSSRSSPSHSLHDRRLHLGEHDHEPRGYAVVRDCGEGK
jgi:hypothetical protein